MKKRVYIAVVTLALASLFAGCGKKSADAAVSVKDDVVEFVNEELPAAKADHDNAIGIYNAYFTGSSDQDLDRSEERRVGKECRSRWSPYH